ncbi:MULTISPECIES: TetR/AcrR family transcriptional regulator [unclassified Chelatococcus]|uniref:TetR/AcrR family transcriptional regulator n=1 Tax=unclassified Chelatococcus TaxID=2638111 RepID=UPI001BCDC03E|nr:MULTISPECIES: TetR/AcrR family transcriptional regulator [unclassified Chelatococcus]MBS7696788.1 TetR/AcrR family transcriptional regulator [Chelatococcus sp. YT9]MBX3558374.1 TetR/AcrR family transcriptional regulator [Chelatococcus sp.]
MTRENRPTRERIIDAAAKLFHAEGVRAVSVDAVAEKAAVTKRTLYYHFRSKDDLIAAYLEIRDQPNLVIFKRWFAEADGDVAQKVEGIFRNLARSARHPKWKGCGFLRTSVELVNLPGHPALAIGRAHKKRVEDWFCATLVAEGIGEQARPLARQIILLLDGAFSVVLLHRDPSYMEDAGEAAAQLIRGGLSALQETPPGAWSG